jgi:heat-inducible transcriptional repressor
MITERQKQILNLIVSLYSKEHTPIGSKSLLDSIQASSATIRNDMKTLEDLGLIQKEHTSSGRVPSTEGYKYFIDHVLTIEEFSQNDLFQIMKAFDGEFYRLSDLFERGAEILSDITGLTSYVLNVPQKEQILQAFQLTMLDNHAVLAVTTLGTGEVRTNQFVLPRSMTKHDLQIFKQIVIERLIGKTTVEAHYTLRTEIPQIVQRYFTSTKEVLELFESIFADLFHENLISYGRQHIFNIEKKDLKELYVTLSDDEQMIQHIRESSKPDEIRSINFGVNGHLENLAIVSQKFLIPYRGLGTLALVGSIDIDYEHILTQVDMVAKVLTMKLTDYYRYLDSNHYEMNRM